MSYQSWSVTFAEQPSASKWNILGTNDASFNDGSGFGNAIVDPSNLNLVPASGYAAAGETTTSTSYADLATTTDTATVTIGANGLALVSFSCYALVNTNNAVVEVSFAVSGATTIAAGVPASGTMRALNQQQAATNSINYNHSITCLVTGLAAGSTTFKMKYATSAGTATFNQRRISVVPL